MIFQFHSSEVDTDLLRRLVRGQRDDGCGSLTLEIVDKNVLVDVYLGESTTEPTAYRAYKCLAEAIRRLERSDNKVRHHWSDLMPDSDREAKITFESVSDISGILNS